MRHALLRGLPPLAVMIAAGLIGTVPSGCGSPRPVLPMAQPLGLTDPALARGQEVFAAYCHQCHPDGSDGLGPAINNKPLPDWLIRTQVRQGLGEMPAFPEDVIDEGELTDLVAYLNHLKR